MIEMKKTQAWSYIIPDYINIVSLLELGEDVNMDIQFQMPTKIETIVSIELIESIKEYTEKDCITHCWNEINFLIFMLDNPTNSAGYTLEIYDTHIGARHAVNAIELYKQFRSSLFENYNEKYPELFI
jgi:hypothetical protein